MYWSILDQGQLSDSDGERYQYAVYDSKLDNELRYQGIANVSMKVTLL